MNKKYSKSAIDLQEFWDKQNAGFREKYNRYSDGSFGGARKKRRRKRRRL